jgi:CBS domain containing-hemolysin-like protein
MLFKLGHIPKPGEWVKFEGRRFTVESMDRNRIAAVRIEKTSAEEVNEGEKQLAGH